MRIFVDGVELAGDHSVTVAWGKCCDNKAHSVTMTTDDSPDGRAGLLRRLEDNPDAQAG